ncbi:hypothetical protein TIFTF001_015616 [Ficus carica]|uniref:NADH dehydrogenase [ubiquinone] 1 alpha subcomplex assembly factor 4 n=1 Tax=Ficus carica TaxID=3494 RepID=A0AA88D5A2_FICCA|nr:hypothetical protein TIFTF001_015616 [Ficus carica]
MGQAFRRASGRIRAASSADATPSSSAAKSAVDRRPPVGPTGGEEISKTGELGAALDSDGAMVRNADNILEERDPQFDAMLSQMAGRIRTKPGGKPEMGEAFVVEKYERPLPKLRNTKPDSSRYEERPTAAGTLNVAQLRHIVLLHEGKADDHDGPMDVHQIAGKFRVDVAEVQRILQFVSLPPEDKKDQKNF